MYVSVSMCFIQRVNTNTRQITKWLLYRQCLLVDISLFEFNSLVHYLAATLSNLKLVDTNNLFTYKYTWENVVMYLYHYLSIYAKDKFAVWLSVISSLPKGT